MGDASGGEGPTSLSLGDGESDRTTDHAHGIPMKQLREMRATRVDVSGLPEGAERRVLAYEPTTISETDWVRIRDRVIEMVVRVSPAKPHDAGRAIRLLAYYLHAVEQDGLDVATDPVEVLFDPIRVESYVTGGGKHIAPDHDRRYFRKYGRSLNPAGAWPKGSPVSVRTERQDPYTTDEVQRILRAVEGMRHGTYRELFNVVVRVVLASGAGTSELTTLRWEDFRNVPGCGWAVDLPGGPARTVPLPARTVPLARPYRSAVVRLAEHRSGLILNESKDPRRLSNTINSADHELRSSIKVTVTRLRTTWMVDRARAGASWVDLAAASGIALESLVRALTGHVDGLSGDAWYASLSKAPS